VALAKRVRALWLALFALAIAAPAQAETALEVQRIILEEAAHSVVPPALVLAVARVESNFEPRAESPTGAKGVMQLMPKTARDVFGVPEYKLWNARLNIQLGINYLAQLYAQYGERWDLALSHYNGGTLEGGSGPYAIPHDYTRKYVADVLHWRDVYAHDVFGAPVPSLRNDGPRLVVVPMPPYAERPWRVASRETTRIERPWRRDARVDPLEYGDWADAHQRRIDARRELND
jgi:hypothetical protein